MVADFGIAQDTTGQLAETTQTEGITVGPPADMSPEQNLGRKLDKRTDIFSLGMTLYYVLTGKVAYKALNRAQLAMAFQANKPTPPSTIDPAISPDLDSVILKMIAVDPVDRYQTCDEVAANLKAYLQGQPTASSHAAPADKHRVSIIALAVVLLLAAGLVGWLLIGNKSNPPVVPDNGTPSESGGGGVAQTPQDSAKGATAGKQTQAQPIAAVIKLPVLVQWVYQPDAGKTFNDSGVITGRSELQDDGLHAGIYIFDPQAGLTAYEGMELRPIDFRIEQDGDTVRIVRDAPDDDAGAIARPSTADFDLETAPTSGYKTLYHIDLKSGMVMLLKCARGGHAKLYIGTPPDPEKSDESE